MGTLNKVVDCSQPARTVGSLIGLSIQVCLDRIYISNPVMVICVVCAPQDSAL